MKFSTADLTILRIRCQKCGQHTEKLVLLLTEKTRFHVLTAEAELTLKPRPTSY